MPLYVISYDFHKERNYTRLYKLLSEWRAVPLLESLWFANLNGTAAGVRDALTKVGDSDDTFAVIELKNGSDWATLKSADPRGIRWLQANIKA